MNLSEYITTDRSGKPQIKDKRKFMEDWTGFYPGKYDTGVYMIGGFYIGKGDIRNRVYSHFRKSIQGIHSNKALQKKIMSALKSGKPVQLRVLSTENSCHEERRLINKYRSTHDLCNIA